MGGLLWLCCVHVGARCVHVGVRCVPAHRQARITLHTTPPLPCAPLVRCTNQLYEDTDAWQPLLPADLAGLPAWRGALLRLVMATPLKFFASVGQWLRSLEGFDLRLHPEDARGWVLASWLPPLAFAGLAWPAMVAAGGVGGWVSWWLGPWLVFHGWTSVLSLAAHTGPHITWAEEVRGPRAVRRQRLQRRRLSSSRCSSSSTSHGWLSIASVRLHVVPLHRRG